MTIDIIERIGQAMADWKHTRREKAIRRKKVELQILRRKAEKMQSEISGLEYDLEAGG